MFVIISMSHSPHNSPTAPFDYSFMLCFTPTPFCLLLYRLLHHHFWSPSLLVLLAFICVTSRFTTVKLCLFLLDILYSVQPFNRYTVNHSVLDRLSCTQSSLFSLTSLDTLAAYYYSTVVLILFRCLLHCFNSNNILYKQTRLLTSTLIYFR